jgi:hypothetical protein
MAVFPTPFWGAGGKAQGAGRGAGRRAGPLLGPDGRRNRSTARASPLPWCG